MTHMLIIPTVWKRKGKETKMIEIIKIILIKRGKRNQSLCFIPKTSIKSEIVTNMVNMWKENSLSTPL